ncbi:hypothetical protein ACJJI4_23785 (plasmid) [Microbulbifer sp. TRSA002]|uniref:hypothetical protein n=1 Tax=Microbulbifer sp. TRSA002 TaxID=3243382 RepID=UPI0040399043
MSSIVHVDFSARKSERAFSADVYSYCMKKYRFQVVAASITEAYCAFVAEAIIHGVNVIRCIAIYFGLADQRDKRQVPARVWQQLDPVAGRLVEY